MGAVRSHFRPEFVNRVDDYIVFHPLTRGQLKRIVELQVARVGKRLVDKKIALHLSESAVAHIAGLGYDPVYGARPVKRVIQQEIETPLAKMILGSEVVDEDVVTVDTLKEADGRMRIAFNVQKGAWKEDHSLGEEKEVASMLTS